MYYLRDLKLRTYTAAAFNTPHVPFFQNGKATDDHFTAQTEQGTEATSRPPSPLFLAEDHTACEAQLPSFFGNIRDVYKNLLIQLEQEASISTALVPASAKPNLLLRFHLHMALYVALC